MNAGWSYGPDDMGWILKDTSFSGGPVQCDALTCEAMSREIEFAPIQGLNESYQVGRCLSFWLSGRRGKT